MLLFFDGFEHYASGDPTGLGFGKWGSSEPGVFPQTSTDFARTGTFSMKWFSDSYNLTTKAYTTSGGFVVGMCVQGRNVWYNATTLLGVYEGSPYSGGILHLAVKMSAGGVLSVYRGATLLATGTTALALNGWYDIEFKGVIHDTAGSYELRIDGVTELIASGIDTRNGGTGIWDRVYLQGTSNAQYVDDFYLCDTSGAAPHNTFLGAVKVETLFPQTDAVAAGSNAGLTPSTGTDHGAMVDENPPNTTDYNGSATVGNKDTYNLPTPTLTGTFFAIQTNLYAAKADAGGRSVAAVVRAGGVDYDGANVPLATSFKNYSEIRTQNPNTSAAWTLSDLTALQVGMKVTV